jgi:hypothetical protein
MSDPPEWGKSGLVVQGLQHCGSVECVEGVFEVGGGSCEGFERSFD